MTNNVAVYIAELSPQFAAELLDGTTGDRRMRPRHVNALAQAMERGEWQLNGAAVCVSRTGWMIDGQHRCAAVIQSGVTVPTILVTGLDVDVEPTLDCGLRRTAADALTIRGETRCAVLAAMLGVLHSYRETGAPVRGADATVPQLLQLLDQHPALRESAQWVTSTRWCQRHLPPSLAGVLHYVFHGHDAAAAERFFAGLESGAELNADSPILHLRNRLETKRVAARTSAALMFKAFRLYQERVGVTPGGLRALPAAHGAVVLAGPPPRRRAGLAR